MGHPGAVARNCVDDFPVKTLATIGGPRELAALNIWLAVSKPENYVRKYVTASRDALRARLDEAKAKKPKP